jgi:malonyl CoA-acyl carrier protein transacylase
LAQEGIQHFLEIGPGTVLSGFVKKILPDAIIASYNGLNDLKMVKEFLA